MVRRASTLLLLVVLGVLGGCRLDVAVDLVIDADGTGELTVTAVADPEVVEQAPGLTEDLRFDDAIAAGWVVEGPSATADGGITVTLRHPVTSDVDATNLLASLGPPFSSVRVEQTAPTPEDDDTTTLLSGHLNLPAGFDSFADADLLAAVGGSPYADALAAAGATPAGSMSAALRVGLPGEIEETTGTDTDGVLGWEAPLDGTSTEVATLSVDRPASGGWAGPVSTIVAVLLVAWVAAATAFIVSVGRARSRRARARRRRRALHRSRRTPSMLEPTRCPVNDAFDPLSPAYLADPFAVLAALDVDDAPVFYASSLDYYVVTRFADVEEAFRDNVTFSAATAQLPLVHVVPEAQQILLAGGHKPQPSMVSLDEPAHARLRGPAARAFTPKRVTDMAATVRRTTIELLAAVDGLERFDLVAALTFPLPARTIFSLMGVPAQDVDRLKSWGGVRAGLGWGRPLPDEQVALASGMAAYRAYLRELVATKTTARGDDLTSDLLAIHDDDPDALTTEEIASILFSLSFAGHETTNNLIANIVRRLLEEPARWQELVSDPGLIPNAVEETLRFDTSVPMWRRVTTTATTLGGVELPAGAKVLLWIAAAGRDPARFDEPDRFDLRRPNARHHIAFGKGIHFCLGANLARLEAVTALEELTRRFPGLLLEADQELSFHPNISFRGPQRLWVRPGPGAVHAR